MNMRAIFIFGLILGFIPIAQPARADIDHRCLNLCVNNGTPAARCLSSCSTGLDSGSVAPLGSSGSSASSKLLAPDAPTKNGNIHRLVNTPTPLGNEVLLAKPVAHAVQPTKNYQCMSQCLQQKMQYATCEQTCTVKPGDTSAGLTQNGNQLPISGTGVPNATPARAIH